MGRSQRAMAGLCRGFVTCRREKRLGGDDRDDLHSVHQQLTQVQVMGKSCAHLVVSLLLNRVCSSSSSIAQPHDIGGGGGFKNCSMVGPRKINSGWLRMKSSKDSPSRL